MPRCITAVNGYLPVVNTSNHEVQFEKGQVLVRGVRASIDPVMEEDNGAELVPVQHKTGRKKNVKFTMEDIENLVNSDLSRRTKENLLELINEYQDRFATNLAELGVTNVGLFETTTTDPEPVVYRPYRLSQMERELVKKQIAELKQYGIIRDSTSPYASPILLVKKKTGEKRLCCDFRRLNAKTVKDRYPLPRIDDLLDRLLGSSWFTTLDMSSGYWQVPVSPDSISKTAFVTPDGSYEWLRMGFGVCNGPAVFQRIMNHVLRPLADPGIFAYIDDVLIASTTLEENFQKLRQVFEALRTANLTLRLDKCRFFHRQIAYLGHEISDGGIRPGQEKMPAVENFPIPTNVHAVRSFLGLASYFRKFIRDFGTIAAPLSKLLRKDAPFHWGEKQQAAFLELKKKIIGAPSVGHLQPECRN